jgi:hypothetical protein
LNVCSSSPIQIRPSLGVSSPAIIRSTVLLPEPLGPRSAVIEPASAVNVTSLTASNKPKRFQSFSTRIGMPSKWTEGFVMSPALSAAVV